MSRERIESAFAAVRRKDFLPTSQASYADQDRALPIGNRQTNSQPTTVRAMLRLLDVQPGQHVLDVGCGSGWTTALLAELVGPEGSVSGVEIIPELVTWGQQNLAGYSLPWATITAADPAALGLPADAPFDRILVSAEARSVSRSLVQQLHPGGVMVAPVAGRMAVVRRPVSEPDAEPDAEPNVVLEGHYRFVPLISP